MCELQTLSQEELATLQVLSQEELATLQGGEGSDYGDDIIVIIC